MNPMDWRFLFADRHCGVSADEQAEMLAELGLNELEDMTRALPEDILAKVDEMDVDAPLTEREAFSVLYGYARGNKPATSMIGLGYYGVDMPAVIRRKLMEDPAWYTAYTPYQPEISQGRLEMLLNFQSMVSDLTALPMAVASLLDEATAAAEAMVLFWRENKSERRVFLADELLFPQTLALLPTRAEPLGITRRFFCRPQRRFRRFAGVSGGRRTSARFFRHYFGAERKQCFCRLRHRFVGVNLVDAAG